MSILFSGRKWEISVVAVGLMFAWLIWTHGLAPTVHDLIQVRRSLDSLSMLSSSLPSKRNEWKQLKDDLNGGSGMHSLSLVEIGSVLEQNHIEHERLKSVVEGGQSSLDIAFSGQTADLHNVWRHLDGWDVVAWSIQPDGPRVRGSFRLQSSKDPR